MTEPITSSEEFMAELVQGKMDFSGLKDKLFIVAVACGDRNSVKCLASTIRGPFSFIEMAEQVGLMWEQQLHHARVIILSIEKDKPAEFLDSGTIDVLESDWRNVVFEIGMDMVLSDKELTPGIRSQSETLPAKPVE